MQTYYIDNTSGSVRNLLLIQKHLSSTEYDGSHCDPGASMPWLTGTKETVESLVDFLATQTSDSIDIYDDDANLVASTHPIEPTERGNPQIGGHYLCLVNEPLSDHIGVFRNRWSILYFQDNEWKGMDQKSIIRWLHLPRK